MLAGFHLTKRRGALALILLALLLYANSLGGGFVWDDEYNYLDNPVILKQTVRAAFTSDIYSYLPNQTAQRYFRPLHVLAYSWLARVTHLHPFALHLFSVGVHALAGVLVFLLIAELAELHVAWFAAALFLVHPLHVEAVAWMAAFSEIFAATLMLSSLYLLVRAERVIGPIADCGLRIADFKPSKRNHEGTKTQRHEEGRDDERWSTRSARRKRLVFAGLSYVAAFAAFLTKETSLVLPVMAGGLLVKWGRPPGLPRTACKKNGRPKGLPHFSQRQRTGAMPLVRGFVAAWPFFALAGCYLAMRYAVLGLAAAPMPHRSPARHASVALSAALQYAKKLVWPWPLAPEYSLNHSAALWVLFAVACVLTGWAAWRSGRARLALLFFLPLAPALAASVMLPALRLMQDRYAYFAVLGFTLLIAYLARYRAGVAVCAALIVVWSALSLAAIPHWRDNEALWSHTLRVTPQSKTAVLGLGSWYYQTRRFTEAEALYREALKRRPADRDYLISLESTQRALAGKR